MRISNRWRALAPLAMVLALAGGLLLMGRSVAVPELVDWLRSRIDAVGPVLGPALFVGVYIVATFLAVPGTPLTLLAGAAFGIGTGLAVMVVASSASASLMFLFARHVFRDRVERRMRRGETARKVERLLDSKGPLVVAASRLVPIFPFLWVNYAWGLTRVPARTYVLWSTIGMLPLNLVHIVLGETALETLAGGDLSRSTQIILVVALVTAALAIYAAYRFLHPGDEND